jgi:hypothetical protein
MTRFSTRLVLRHAASPLVLALMAWSWTAACSDNASPSDAFDVSAPPADAVDADDIVPDTDPHADTDPHPDTGDGGDTGEDTALPDADPDAPEDAPGFSIFVPATFPEIEGVRVPFVVRAITPDGGVDASMSVPVAISVEAGLEGAPDVLDLRRGVGSVTAGLYGDGRLRVGNVTANVRAHTPAVEEVSGDIAETTAWTSGRLYRVRDDVRIPNGVTLTVEAGTWVVLDEDVNVFVDGTLDVRGTADEPVVFTSAGDAWGGLIASSGARIDVVRGMFVGGGGDDTRHWGHSNSQPVIRGSDATVTFVDSVIQDCEGKAMGAVEGSFTIARSLITRTDTGGEFERASVEITDSHYLNIREGNPSATPDDNDGVYFYHPETRATVLRSTFIGGTDDGIDHNGAQLEVRQSWVEGFDNECVATSNQGRVVIADTVLRGCAQCLEAGYEEPEVVGSHLVITGCDVGLRFGDNYAGRTHTGTLSVTDSIIFGNAEHAILNLDPTTEAPVEGAITVSTSLLDANMDAVGDGSGNIEGTPTFTDYLLLAAESPGRGACSHGYDVGLITAQPR